jgi:enoyl-CoA hydratase/carnithine racemase
VPDVSDNPGSTASTPSGETGGGASRDQVPARDPLAADAIPEALVNQLTAAGLRLERTGRRADVVLCAPDRRNAQTPATWLALAAIGSWLTGRVDVAVIRAVGASFSAGLDRRAFTPDGIPGEPGLFQLAAMDDAELDARVASYQGGFTVWSAAPFLSIAAVQGAAVGAGFQLALACDLRLAADDARFAMREPSLGLVPDLGGTRPLVAAVGYPRALEICATGRWVAAEEAARLGLVQAVVAADQLPAEVDRWADLLLAAPAAAVRATKLLLRDAVDRDPVAQLAAERTAQAARLRDLARSASR